MRTRVVAIGGALLALTTSRPALAMGALVADPPGASTAVSVKVAVASAPGRTVRWGSLQLLGTARSVAWLVPVAPGAALDLASDAWLEGLEAATAPRVVPPDVIPPCGVPGGVEVEADFTHTATAAPGAIATAADRATLDATLAGWGLSLTSDVAPGIDAAFAAGNAVVALRYEGASGDVVLRTVRVVDDGPARLPLALVQSGTTPVAVTAFVIGAGGIQLGAQPPIAIEPSAVLWRPDGTSTYASVRDALLAGSPGGWLFETGGHDALFDDTPVPGASAAPSLCTSYDFRAASYADASLPPDGCVTRASAIADSGATVAWACPAGQLARVAPASGDCQELVGAGEIDPEALRCGGIADDLALALSGLAPQKAWVTRARGSVPALASGVDTALTASGIAGPYGPVVTSSGYAQTCTAPGGAGGGGSGAGTPGGSGAGASPGSGGSGAGDPGDPGGAAVAGIAAATDIASAAADSGASCNGDSSGSSDSCSGDSSSASGDASGGCSGDTGTGGEGGSGCGVGANRSKRRPIPLFPIVMSAVALAAAARRRRRIPVQ